MTKGRKKQHVYNPCHGEERLILTQQGRAGIPEGLAPGACATAASAEHGGREAQHTSFGGWAGSLRWLQGEKTSHLLCVEMLACFPAVHFWLRTVHSAQSAWPPVVASAREPRAVYRSALSASTLHARQSCHFPYSYCYRLPKHISYLLIIGSPVPGMVLSK